MYLIVQLDPPSGEGPDTLAASHQLRASTKELIHDHRDQGSGQRCHGPSRRGAPGPRPRRPSAGSPCPGRRRAGQPGHPGCHRLLVDAPLSQRVSLRQAGGGLPQLEVAAAAAADHPLAAPLQVRGGLPQHLEHREGREPAFDHHPGADPQGGRGTRGAVRGPGDGRLLHALRQPVQRQRAQADAGGWLREDPLLPALPPVRLAHHRHRQRPRLPYPDDPQVAARPAHRARLLRAPALYRGAGQHGARGLRRRRDPAGGSVASYHGVPKRFLMEGDPYHCQCQKTTRLLREALGWEGNAVQTAFQSQFGPEEWVGPQTVEHVAELARQGKKHIAVVSPAFASDCVETLEEIEEEIRDAFIEAGGETFTYIPCLNDRDDHITALLAVIENELAGWVSRRP